MGLLNRSILRRPKVNNFMGLYATAPYGYDGYFYINTVDNGYYVYYGDAWQLLHTLTPSMVDHILLENGGKIINEDMSGHIIKE